MNKTKEKVRRKVTQACENCREKRIKCSGEKPSCRNCFNLKIDCVYNAFTKKRGPRSGYIEEIVSKRVQKEIERIVTNHLISNDDIHELAKNNQELFNSNNLLKNYIKNTNKEKYLDNNIPNKTQNKTQNDIINQELFSLLSKINKDEILIFDKYKQNEVIIFNNNNKPKIYDYFKIKIDFSLIDIYFRFSHYYFPILEKDIFMERLKSRTLFPGLLLAVYSAAYLYRPKPDIELSKKYKNQAYDYVTHYKNEINIQIVQTYALISNCVNGTNSSWLSLGISLNMAYLLNLNCEDLSQDFKHNEERRLTFWHILCKDMIVSVITGRSYKYDINIFLNSKLSLNVFKYINSNKQTINLILHIILANILRKVIQYIKKHNSNTNELNLLEKEIDYWFKVFEPIFKYEIDETTDIAEIYIKLNFDILFSTLKIVLYRHKPTSVIIQRNVKPSQKLINFIYEIYNNKKLNRNTDINKKFLFVNEPNIENDFFMGYSYDILNKDKSKSNKIKECPPLNPLHLNQQLSSTQNIKPQYNMKKQKFPEIFINNETIYIKKIKEQTTKIDYNVKCKGTTFNTSDIYNLNSNMKKDNPKSNYEAKSNNLKRNRDQNISDVNGGSPQIKKSKINDDSSILESKIDFFDNLLISETNDIYLEKVYNSLLLETSNNNPENYNNLKKKENNNQILNSTDSNNYSNFIYQEVLNPLDENNEYDNLLTKYLNDQMLETQNASPTSQSSQNHDNTMTALSECYRIALSTTKKIKLLKSFYDKSQIPYEYITSWCFYQIGIIFMMRYVKHKQKEDLEMIIFYENLLDESVKYHSSIAPYLSQYREMRREAEIAVKNGTRKLVIKDVF